MAGSALRGERNASDAQGGLLQHGSSLYRNMDVDKDGHTATPHVGHEQTGPAVLLIVWELDAGNVQG